MASAVYVQATPSDRLLFTPENASTARSTLAVANATQLPVAFKVKTNAPSLFAIHPAHGTLRAGESVSISIIASDPGSLAGANRIQLVSIPHPFPADPHEWSSDSRRQTLVLETRLLPSAEFLSMRSFTSTSFDPTGSRESLEVKRVVQELRAECDELQHEVEDLRRKTRVLEAGVLSHRSPPPKPASPSGFSNLHLLLCLLLGLLLSVFLH